MGHRLRVFAYANQNISLLIEINHRKSGSSFSTSCVYGCDARVSIQAVYSQRLVVSQGFEAKSLNHKLSGRDSFVNIFNKYLLGRDTLRGSDNKLIRQVCDVPLLRECDADIQLLVIKIIASGDALLRTVSKYESINLAQKYLFSFFGPGFILVFLGITNNLLQTCVIIRVRGE